MEDSYSVGEFTDNCCEIQLAKQDLDIFQLDNVNVLLEVRPKQDEYGVFYTAKGRQWDIWCRADEADTRGGAAFAMRDPVQAVRGLLARNWRADFGFDPDEDD
jgi:hypothetical protein